MLISTIFALRYSQTLTKPINEVLGHTLESIGTVLGLSMNFEAIASHYVDIQLERKKEVFDVYHDVVGKQEAPKTKEAKPKKATV